MVGSGEVSSVTAEELTSESHVGTSTDWLGGEVGLSDV